MASTKQPAVTEEETKDLMGNNDQTDEELVDTTDDNKAAEELAGLPVDTGWAWVILFAAIFGIFIFGGLMKSYGIFFVQFQQKFGSSASETALIQTVANTIISVSGIFVMTIGMNHMTARTSVCIGALIISGSYVIGAYATRTEVLIFSLGGMTGVSVNMIILPIVSTIGIYFNKRRGLANSLTVSGASLGSLVFGPLYTFMFDYYGYTGTMLITAGLLLNILISGCLLRPPDFYTRRNRMSDSSEEKELMDLSESKESLDNGHALGNSNELVSTSSSYKHPRRNENEDNLIQNRLLKNNNHLMQKISESPEYKLPIDSQNLPKRVALNIQRTRSQSFNSETTRDNTPASPMLQRTRAASFLHKRTRTVSETSHEHKLIDTINKSNIALYSAADMCGSLASLNIAQSELIETVTATEHETSDNHQKKTCFQVVKSAIKNFLRTVFDVSLLKDPVFIHYILFASVSLPASTISSVYFIPFAKDIGVDNQRIGMLLFVIGLVDLVSRVSVGVIADKKWFRPTTIITFTFMLMAVVNSFTHAIHTFWTLLVFVIIQSSLSGTYPALFAVILIDHLGMAKFKSSLGFTSMFHGVSVAIFFPITGSLRDSSGTYYWTYHLLSILLVLGAVLAFTLPITYRRTRRESKETTKVTA